MSWRDHLLEWLCALGVAIGTLVALHQIESRAAVTNETPPPPDPVQDVPVLGFVTLVERAGLETLPVTCSGMDEFEDGLPALQATP